MNMVTVANCHTLDEAISFKMVLEAAGIDSFIPDENASSVAPHHFLTPSGVRLQVADEKLEEAKRLLDQARGE